MLIRLSALLLQTLREDPVEAELASHKLLLRAGFVRRIGPGIYSWLPLGLMVLRNIEAIVREEMLAIGAQEVLLPALIPREFFERSGRWADYGDALFRLQDRRQVDYLLGPTHEELFTHLVKSECSSYKDLPLSLFQIQTKFRDEARPRAGVLRGREFLMKDSYSFDMDDDGLDRSYQAHRAAYGRIFTRLGLDFRVVSAVSGAMGGSASEEFIAPAAAGEDTIVACDGCDYAANAEAVELAATALPVSSQSGRPPAVEVDTPSTPTIATLVARLGEVMPDRSFATSDTLKNVVVKTRGPGAAAWSLLVVGVPGDREVDMKRLAAQLEPIEVLPAGPEDLAAVTGLIPGYIGPQILAGLGVRYLVDPLVVEGSAWVTGANRSGLHAVDVVRGRDFTPDGEIGAVEVRDGDVCARCGGSLRISRGIELGHVFQLGRKYAEAFGLAVSGPDGQAVTVTMGSYGIGITRAVAAVAEQTHDDLGLRWPRSIAPADVHLVVTGKGPEPLEAGSELADALEAAGLRVIYDDRVGPSAGVKFSDAELIGVPTIVILGRGLVNGLAEVRDRWTGERRDVPLVEVVAALLA